MFRRMSDEQRAAQGAGNPRQSFARLMGYLRPYRIQLAVVVVLVVVFALLNILGPYLMGVAIDDFIETKDAAGLAKISLLMFSVYLGMWLAGAGYGRLMAAIAQKAMRRIRQDLFEHMQRLSLSFYNKESAGDLMSRLTNDMDNINQLLSQNLVNFLSSMVGLVGVLIAMFALNMWLALATLAMFPVIFLVLGTLIKRIGPAFRVQQQSLGKLNGLMEENLSGQRVVIAYAQQDNILQEFETTNVNARQAGIKAQTLAGLMFPLTMGLNNLNLAVVVGVGAFMAINGLGGVTVGLIATYTSYARSVSHPLMQVSNLFSSIMAALAGAERIFEVLDTEPAVRDKLDAETLTSIDGEICFRDVDFGYNPDSLVLQDINLHAKPGQRFALVGPTGAGKTTIVSVLSRFYDIAAGTIHIDGREIRDVAQRSLRRQLGIVLQDTYLFSATVMENIRYGRLDATDEEVYQAAKLANAHGFIVRLPEGYNTLLSERAGDLSQGQRQLLAIARAILANPRILILDEATSSVDTRTEHQIQAALRTLMEGRTSFVIAHRLSTIREADQILVVNEGRIIERGRHQELLAAKGFYHNLYTSQFKGTAVTT